MAGARGRRGHWLDRIRTTGVRRAGSLLGAVLLLAVVLPASTLTAHAATIWYVNGDGHIGSNSNNCLSPTPNGAGSGPCFTIQAAVNKASTGDTIEIAGSDVAAGGIFNGVYCEEITLLASLTIEAATPGNPPAIDGGFGPYSPCLAGTVRNSVVTVGDPNSMATITVSIKNLTIQDGDASTRFDGGGIYDAPNATLDLSGVTVTHNVACSTCALGSHGEGGGIYVAGSAVITNSTVAGNTACIDVCHGSGGGIATTSGNVTLIDSAVTDNIGCGCASNSQLELAVGGGITVYISSQTGNTSFAVIGSTISNNAACAVCHGSVEALGGGIYAYMASQTSGASFAVIASTISNNTACASCWGAGGGLYAWVPMDIVNSTISGNTICTDATQPCTADGGGMVLVDPSDRLLNDTVAGNSLCSGSGCTGSGGGIYTFPNSVPQLGNTIVAGNTGNPSAAGSPDCDGTVQDATASGNNLIGNGSGCTGLTGSGDQIGSTGSPIDPRLGPLQHNGGPTPTMALLSNSPAIHGGGVALCDLFVLPDGNSGPAALDQRGLPRPTSATCDIGAFDTLGYPTTYVSPSGDDSSTCSSAASPCRHVAVGAATASFGGTVQIAAGTYCEQVTLGHAVTLRGTGSVILDGGGGSGNPCAALDPPGSSVVSIGTQSGTTAAVTLDHLTIRHGSGVNGAGIHVFGGSTLTLTGSTVQNNQASQYGGGIDNEGTATITNSAIQNNQACASPSCSGVGGGIFNYFAAPLNVTNSTISGNAACVATGCHGTAGGIQSSIGTTTITNSTITANTACSGPSCTGTAGGLATPGAATILATTIANNTACSGSSCTGTTGGLEHDQTGSLTVTLAGTIVAGNIATQGSPDCKGAIGDAMVNGSPAGNNLIGDSAGCTFTPGNGDQVGGNGRPVVNPLLASLANNGGATFTLALQTGSPAIGKGSTAVCTSTQVGDRDQRGDPRNTTSRHACDIGAYDTGGVGATAARIRWFHVKRAGASIIASWRMVRAQGVLGFALYQGRRRLTRRLIPVQHGRLTYHYRARVSGGGRVTLAVLTAAGAWTDEG